MKRKLTPKQQKFADSYIETGNATQAAIDAGYSKKTAKSVGSENLTKPDIKSYIEERMQEIADNSIMDAREAIELLTKIARGEEKETVVISSPEGIYETQKEADIKTRISAVKEILKRYPDNDELLRAQIRKLNAEADIKEEQSKAIKEDGLQVVPLIISAAPKSNDEQVEVNDNGNITDQ